MALSHLKPSQHIRPIVYGGMDGIITTFAIVAGATGAQLSYNILLVLGIANLLADGLSMGAGEYMSSKAELEHQFPKGTPKEEQKAIRISALYTFFSFLLFGTVPLLIYGIAIFFPVVLQESFWVASALAAMALCALGLLKAKLNSVHWLRSTIEVLGIGLVTALVAYGVGHGLSQLILHGNV